MARTQKDLEGWQILIMDENDQLIDYFEQKRPRRRRGNIQERKGKDQVYLKRAEDGILLSVGDSVVTKLQEGTGDGGICVIQDIRLNTLSNLVELWVFLYIKPEEIDPEIYLRELAPDFKADNQDSIKKEISQRISDKELFFSATLIEIKLEDIVEKAKIFNKDKWETIPQCDKEYTNTFVVQYACDPQAGRFMEIDINAESKHMYEWMPKKSLEYYKRITEPASPETKRQNTSATVIDLLESDERKSQENPSKLEKVVNEEEVLKETQKRRPGRPKKIKNEDIIESSTSSGTQISNSSSAVKKRGRPKLVSVDETNAITKSSMKTKKRRIEESTESFDLGNDNIDDVPINSSESEDLPDDNDDDFKIEEEISGDVNEESLLNDDDLVSEKELLEEEEEEEDDIIDDKDENNKRIKARGRPRKNNIDKGVTTANKAGGKAKKGTKGNTSTIYITGSVRKFTKKNVVRAKKGYTPFSKRYKSIDDIPDLMKLADFNQESTLNYFAKLGNRLKTNDGKEQVETIFSKIKKQLTSFHNKDEIVKSGNISDYLPARENEFASLYLSVYSAIESESATTIYIAGTPGVGKTLTVREVISDLQLASHQGEIPKFQYVEINGLKMVKPTDSYEFFWNKISGEELTWAAAMESLEFYFNKIPREKKRPIVVLLDELDALVTKSQDVMYNFFNWSTYENAKLIVISVANTMDLPEKQLGNKVSSRIGFTRIMFTGYTHEELKTIIKFRLQGLNNSCFYVDTKTGKAKLVAAEDKDEIPAGMKKVRLRITDDAIEIASRKVASVSGDARRALKVCKRAAEIAEKHYMAKYGYGYDGKAIIEKENEANELEAGNEPQIENDGDDEIQIVNINHIMKALNETINSNSITFISRLAFGAKVFIYALLNLMKKNSTLDQVLGDVIDEVKLLLDNNNSNKYLRNIQQNLFSSGGDDNPELRMKSWDYNINQLIEAGILSKQSMRNERMGTVRLMMAVEDVREAIEKDDIIREL
ncbi:Origin recognition complex subunit 1 [Nakaseomyces bracarensis]|uniref:Origin recognition complex subunit 1 n=1 Tax=Nakaseomyces bracarensis TaxID=273131 RepID=A0ABR4NXD7_9SACH